MQAAHGAEKDSIARHAVVDARSGQRHHRRGSETEHGDEERNPLSLSGGEHGGDRPFGYRRLQHHTLRGESVHEEHIDQQVGSYDEQDADDQRQG